MGVNRLEAVGGTEFVKRAGLQMDAVQARTIEEFPLLAAEPHFVTALGHEIHQIAGFSIIGKPGGFEESIGFSVSFPASQFAAVTARPDAVLACEQPPGDPQRTTRVVG